MLLESWHIENLIEVEPAAQVVLKEHAEEQIDRLAKQISRLSVELAETKSELYSFIINRKLNRRAL